jgi:hypothetical protein
MDACKALPDRTEQFLEGLEALKRHGQITGPTGSSICRCSGGSGHANAGRNFGTVAR